MGKDRWIFVVFSLVYGPYQANTTHLLAHAHKHTCTQTQTDNQIQRRNQSNTEQSGFSTQMKQFRGAKGMVQLGCRCWTNQSLLTTKLNATGLRCWTTVAGQEGGGQGN